MNRKYYSTYVFYAVMSCCIVVGYAYLRGESFQWLGVGIALILGIILYHLLLGCLYLVNTIFQINNAKMQLFVGILSITRTEGLHL
ncbi:Uncharacterised protein [Acinetobacter haemolyticus]|nr:Uncharacterised protein [Acinetobacter haemolyticus]